MTTDAGKTNKLIKDMGAVKTPVFYIFTIAAAASSVIVYGINAASLICAAFLILLSAAAAADINKRIVPDLVVIIIAVTGIINLCVNGISLSAVIDSLLGAICLSLPMLIASLIIRKAFGGGDIKLIAAAGIYLGLSRTLAAGVIAFLIAGIYSIALLAFKKCGVKETVTFAPYLALGCAFSALFGRELLFVFYSYI